MRRVLYWAGGLAGALLLVGGTVLAVRGAVKNPGPDDVVRAYFSALARADAPAALQLGTIPAGPHELLTSAVLREQQQMAPLRDVGVGPVQVRGAQATVQVTYVLDYPGRPHAVTEQVGLHRGGDRWRLDQVAVATELELTNAAQRARAGGARVPTGTTLVFPGAAPISFDTPYLQLDPVADSIRLGGSSLTEVGVQVSAAGRRDALAATAAALRACLGPAPEADCPLPSGRYVPGTVRATDTGSLAGHVTVRLADSAAGLLEIAGTEPVSAATYERLDFANQPIVGHGRLNLQLAAHVYARSPLQISLDGTVIARFVRTGALVAAAALLTLVGAGPAGAAPGPPRSPEYWFDSWQVPSLWSAGVRGQGVTIAEIDTGVNASLPELTGRVLAGADLGLGGDGQIDREVDRFGHGTAMASIMVARPGVLDITGLAPDAKILPIAVPLNGTTDAGRADQLPQAIRYAVAHHAKIINMSLGGERTPALDGQPCNSDEQAAIFDALRKGVLVLASVGNTGPTKNTVEDPAVCIGVVSVGAEDQSGRVAGFSAREPFLTMVAPGVNIPSLGRVAGQAYSGNGTSQATALASAAAALVWSRYPKLTAGQVLARILYTLDARRHTASDAYGYGRLDAYRAVTAHVPTDAPNPVYAAAAPFLARTAQLHRPAPAAPPPAPARARAVGRYAVGPAPGTSREEIVGTALGAAGLLVLLFCLGFGSRDRLRRALR